MWGLARRIPWAEMIRRALTGFEISCVPLRAANQVSAAHTAGSATRAYATASVYAQHSRFLSSNMPANFLPPPALVRRPRVVDYCVRRYSDQALGTRATHVPLNRNPCHKCKFKLSLSATLAVYQRPPLGMPVVGSQYQNTAKYMLVSVNICFVNSSAESATCNAMALLHGWNITLCRFYRSVIGVYWCAAFFASMQEPFRSQFGPVQ